MTERDDFDKIIEGLDLDLDLDLEFPDEPADPVWIDPSPRPEPVEDVEVEVPFYRQVRATPLIPRSRGAILAWGGVLGAPLLLVVATVIGEILPRPILAGAVLIFVAAAIYLISQLPEHGPSRPDWPDDGAVL